MRYFTCFTCFTTRKAEDEAEALRVITFRQDDFLFFFHFFLAIARKAEEAAEAERVILIREGAVKGQKEKANLKDGKVERKKKKGKK